MVWRWEEMKRDPCYCKGKSHPVTLLSNCLGQNDFPDYMLKSLGLAVALGRDYSSCEKTGTKSR